MAGTTASPIIVAICGVKNSGKTTFITGLLPLLKRHAIRTAVIKHDGHDFTPDVPGTDSFRMREAGADAVAVYSTHRFLFTEQRSDLAIETLLPLVADYDLVLFEGGKQTDFHKIEIVRQGNSEKPICNRTGLLAVATDRALPEETARVIGLNDYQAACDLIRTLAGKERDA